MGVLDRLKARLGRTREALSDGISGLFKGGRPMDEDTLVRLDTALKYGFGKGWTLALGYAFESFQKSDWRTDRLNPFLPGVTSIWLGNDARDYDAHIVSLTLGYRFK